jgi:hypothetical protein
MLILLAILAAGSVMLAALWVFRGREISSFIDRYWTVETQSSRIQSIAYEGSGTGGILICNGVSFSLNELAPGLSLSIGSTKDNHLASATSGKVFPFGRLHLPQGMSANISLPCNRRLGNGTFMRKLGGRNRLGRSSKCFGITSNFFIRSAAGRAA